MKHSATGTFQIQMQPQESSSPQISRMSFSKTWEGGLSGVSQGEFLSVGDPKSGTAAYTVMEVFNGVLDGKQGSFAFHQYGTMHGGAVTLRYEVVPHSGSAELTGISGELVLNVVDKVHHFELKYEVNP